MKSNSKVKVFRLFLFISVLFLSCSKHVADDDKTGGDDNSEPKETYDNMVLKDRPVGYWLFDFSDGKDAGTAKHNGSFLGGVGPSATLPNGDKANVFNGTNAYFEIPDADHLEISASGILTVEAWMRPDVLDFPEVESGKDYIHWMGKGEPDQHSWAARMYNKDSWRENRPNRISGYAFNPEGGLGAGSYFQDDDLVAGKTWIYFVFVINTKNVSSKYPTGYTKIFRDGKLRDQDDLQSYGIIPKNGTAPIRIATRDKKSFFQGSIGKVALYDYELSPERINAHLNKMIH